MAQTHFDPARMVRFDLARGRVALDEASCRVLVPTDLLLELCENAGQEALTNFGRRIGTECGRRVVERLGQEELSEANVSTLLAHLGGELALMGLGSLGVERWGRALVMVFEGSPVGSRGDHLLAAVLEGAFQRLFGRDCSVVKLGRDDELVRLLVVGAQTAAAAREALRKGTGWGELLSQLHEASAQSERE